jgi:hypothetical protein
LRRERQRSMMGREENAVRRSATIVALLFAMSVVGAVSAAPVTLEGKVVCAKCSLKEKGQADCQNVLVVEREGKTEHYYIAKNEVATKFGDVCQGTKPVRVTGEVEQKDGRHWIAATEIAPVPAKS